MNIKAPYRVRVIVDPIFGEKLAALPTDEPVWIIDSASNTPVAHRLWQERPATSHLPGITTFAARSGATPEDELLAHLDTIDLHHGAHSADPPYSIIEVIGSPASDRLRAVLGDLGFTIDSSTSEGFLATNHGA